MLIEYQQGMENWDIPYFEGMQSVKMPVLTTTGKNLFDDNTVFKQGYVNYMTGGITMASNATDMITDYIPFSNAGEFTISYDGDRRVDIVCYDSNKNYINGVAGNGSVVTITEKTAYIVVMVRNISNVKNRVQIEKGTQVTPYEPYKTNILTVNEDVTLRGIGDVRDTLDLTTGELTQRIGEIVLDGSEDWTNQSVHDRTNTKRYILSINDTNLSEIYSSTSVNVNLLSNFKANSPINRDTDIEGITMICWNKTTKDISIRVNKTTVNSLDEFKNWLSQNPITLQYHQASESIKTVDFKHPRPRHSTSCTTQFIYKWVYSSIITGRYTNSNHRI